MKQFDPSELKSLYVPSPDSHKGQNGKLMIIGGSHLFHGASLWALKIASRIVDMVFYSSVPENNEIVKQAKEEFRDGIVVERSRLDNYIEEADCILIGPGLPRKEGVGPGDDDTQTLTTRLLEKYKDKLWVIDGGSLQVIDPTLIPPQAILTPHEGEFEKLFKTVIASGSALALSEANGKQSGSEEIAASPTAPRNDVVSRTAREYNCVILLKGEVDRVCSPTECVEIAGGNAGMTKGGTGDVLAGLVAALACKNDPFLAAKVGSYINKKAGESLERRVGLYFNSSDLCDEIPKVMKELLVATL